MCGIAGAIGPGHRTAGKAHLPLSHRGPDGGHAWSADSVTLGHTRLSVLDLTSAADQPMHSVDGRVTLVFNGEIYNHLELRRELEAKGVRFRGTGDTETLLEGYLAWGEEVVRRLRGMFAFAIWDSRSGELLVVRDRLGIKPLFWMKDGDTLRFGSEIKSVLAQLAQRPKTRSSAIAEYLVWLYVPPPGTFYEGIQELPPGHLLRWKQGSVETQRYWQVPNQLRSIRFDDAARELRSVLEETVKLHLLSDVPLGAFLSGGLDSASVVALMAQASSKPVRTFCMTFTDARRMYDEREYARAVADRYGTQHEEIPVEVRVTDLMPSVIRHFDQPFGNPTAFLVYELSRLTRQHVTVALSGDGGDEVMLGYPRYAGVRWLERYQRTPALLRKAVAHLSDRLIRESSAGNHTFRRAREFLSSAASPKAEAYASWVSYLGVEGLSELFTPEWKHEIAKEPWRDLVERFAEGPVGDGPAAAARTDLQTFLPGNILTYSDRMSMAHGLEVRVPYCDHVLVEYCASLPSDIRMRGGGLKALMREAVKDLLPPTVQRRGKLGFNPPLGVWLNGPLRERVDELLSPSTLRARGIFEPTAVKRLQDEHARGARDHSLRIWSLVVLEEWMRSLT